MHPTIRLLVALSLIAAPARAGLTSTDGENTTGQEQVAETLTENAEEYAETYGMTTEEVLALAESIASGSGGSTSGSGSGFAEMEETGEYEWTKSIGDESSLGAALQFRAGYWGSSEKKGVYADAAAYVYALGAEYEVVGAHAYSYNTPSDGEARYELVWLDSTIREGELEGDFTLSPETPYELSKGWDYQFTVGPVPVNVSLEIGFTFDYSLGITFSATGAGIGGGFETTAYGSASAAVGGTFRIGGITIVGLEAGIRVTLNLFDATFDGGLVISPIGAATGLGFTLELEAIEILLDLYLWGAIGPIEKEWSLNVWEWELYAQTISFLDGELEIEAGVDEEDEEDDRLDSLSTWTNQTVGIKSTLSSSGGTTGLVRR